jgi:hypothetical protein
VLPSPSLQFLPSRIFFSSLHCILSLWSTLLHLISCPYHLNLASLTSL